MERDSAATGYVRQVGDAIEDAEGGQPDVFLGVDHDCVTIHVGSFTSGGHAIALDAAQAEDFAALFTAACWQASANAGRMRAEHEDGA